MKRYIYSYYNEDNIDNIISGLKHKTEYVCNLPFTDDNSELLITRVVELFLAKADQINMQQSIALTVNEIVIKLDQLNKRHSYFVENNLDINSRNDLEKGLKELIDGKYYKGYKKRDKYIKVEFKVSDREFYIKAEAGVSCSSAEMEKFKEQLEISNKFESVEQVVTENPELISRHGFGLILTLLTLQHCNIDKEAIVVSKDDNKTTIELTIPFEQLANITINRITDEIAEEIKSLPQFPDSIRRLQAEVMDPEWDFDRISDYILSDSALTAEILRVVNSPAYKVEDRIDKVSTAVKRIGINGLKAMTYNFGSMMILESRYDINKITRYKEHLFQVALISSYLARIMKLDDFAEDIYVAALMHDIGKIIIQAINNELFDSINEVCKKRNISIDAIDKLSDGYNHSVVGARLSDKWSFPEKFTYAIRYHHQPHEAPEEYRIITYCVYLGNSITQIIEGNSKYSNINSSVLKFFNLDTVDKFKNFMVQIKKEGLVI